MLVNRGMKRNDPIYNGRPRSVAGDKSMTRNSVISNGQNRSATRRVSLGSIHSASSTTAVQINRRDSLKLPSPTTSPIPHRRYSIQRSVSPALMTNHSTSSNSSVVSNTSSRASKYSNKNAKPSSTKKWSN